MLTTLKNIFSPNKTISKTAVLLIIGVQFAIALLAWYATGPLIPKPHEIGAAFSKLLGEGDLLRELFVSTGLCLEALIIAIAISLGISYLTVIPFFRPPAFIVSKGRFLTLVGLSFVFTLMVSSGHGLKVWLMVFGITVFFVTSMVAMIKSIPRSEFNHARTLRMGEWQTVWEVVILGKLDQVFEITRQNFAIAWMMLTMVEGISRSEGGIGTMLLNQNKHLHLDAVFAIQLVILTVGIFMDYLIGVFKNLFCPYASLTLERK
ncbi:MAG: nitrate ABC transporter permease [Saprospiraceae bacterium]|nr:nitrate ABC transporter permease [Saprospiraceae bacterium]